jgi:serine/threonine-protein kinase HipA
MALPGQKPHYLLKSIQRRHFETLAKRMGLGGQADKLIDEVLQRTPTVVDAVQTALPKDFPQGLLERVLGGLAKAARDLK